MGGSGSRQRRIRKAELIQGKQQESNNTFNLGAGCYSATNTNDDTIASNSDNTPTYKNDPLNYGCGSNYRMLPNTKYSTAKSLNNNYNNLIQLLPDDSNQISSSEEAREFQQNVLPKENQNYSNDDRMSNISLRTPPFEAKISIIKNSCDGYVDLTNSNESSLSEHGRTENADTNIGKVGSMKRNSEDLDEDERPTRGEYSLSQGFKKSSSDIDVLFDSLIKHKVKRKVPNDHAPTSVNTYSKNGITKLQYERGFLGNSDYNNCAELCNGVEKSDEELDLDLSFDVLDILSFPIEWSSCALENTGFVDITPESDEGRAVQRLFHKSSVSGSFKLQITKVTRVENLFLHSLYMLKKEEMKSRNGNVDELYLYHGTKNENVDKICQDNLNWRLYTERHRFGRGVSFSPSAIYSSHYSDSSNKKVMFLFKVLVSNSVHGSSNMVIPPKDRGVFFDTSIKDDTTVVVKYSDNEFYPLYKITYNRHSNV